MGKFITRLLLSLGFFLLSFLLILVAKEAPDFLFSFYPELCRKAHTALSNITSFVPFGLWEAGLALGLLLDLILLIRAFTKKHFWRWLAGQLLVLSIGVFLFVSLYGLNYYAPTIAQQMELPEKTYTVQELKEATLYYRDMAQQAAREVDRDEGGFFLPGEFSELAEEAGRSFAPLAEDYACFDGSKARVKYLLSSPILAKTGTTGLFVCFTGESGVSKLCYEIQQPHTMCHEAAHRLGFAREDEANFAAFLACCASDRPDFRYSGYSHAFVSCYNALYAADPESARKVWEGCSELLRNDLLRANDHYAALRNETAEKISDTVYDGYLKSFSVAEGRQSYGKVADLLLIWYFEEIL